MGILEKISSTAYDKIVKRYPAFAQQDNAKAKQPNLKETAPLSHFINTYFKFLTDQDNVLKYKAKGKGRQFYDNMVDDDAHISASINIRKLAVVGQGWEILPFVERGQSEPTDRAIECADVIDEALRRMKNFNANLREILQAIQHGYSIGELMWRIDPDMVVVEDIKNHRPDRFKYDLNMELYHVDAGKEELLDKDKFFRYTHNPRYNNPYGTSVLRSVYWPYWFKTNMIKFLVLFAERYGNPALIGKYPAGWGSGQIDELVASLVTVQGTSVGAVPEGTDIDILQSSDTKADFVTALGFFNAEISKGIIGQTLSTDEGMRVGSMALGKVHESVRMDILEADSVDLSFAVNDQLIRQLIEFNLGDVVEKPTFMIAFAEPEDDEKKANSYLTLAGIGMEFPKKFIHDEFSVPMPEKDEETYGGRSPSPFGLSLRPNSNENDKSNSDEEKEAPQFKSNQLFGLKGKQSFGRLVGRQPPESKKQFDIATNFALLDEFHDQMTKIFTNIQTRIFQGMDLSLPMQGLIDQAVRAEFQGTGDIILGDIIGQNMDLVTDHFAGLFGLGRLDKQLAFGTFQKIKNDYLISNFYTKGTLNGVADTTQKILSNKIPTWAEVGFDNADMKRTLLKTFKDMKPWRAQMITQTEMSNAAHHAAFKMIESTGIEFEAYFHVDPASCIICTDIAAQNPHTVDAAKGLWPPHIQCNDQFEFVQKGKEVL